MHPHAAGPVPSVATPAGRRRASPPLAAALAAWLLLGASPGAAQTVVAVDQRLAFDRPEAWAMAYLAGSTRFAGFGAPQAREPGSASLGLELSEMPHLSTARRRVGFDGAKLEDLNKSPAFGRLRAALGLPREFTLELAWTPPLGHDGVRPERMLGLALERPIREAADWRLGLRAHYQRGSVQGDITCDRRTASLPPGASGNPYGCRAPSKDRYAYRLYGLEMSAALQPSGWRTQPFASLGYARLDAATRLDAAVFSVVDRSRLSTRGGLRSLDIGLTRSLGTHWEGLLALNWTPLAVRRPPLRDARSDDLWSLRLGVRRTLR